MGLEQAELPGELDGLPYIILIEEGDVGRLRHRNACITGARHAPICLRHDGDPRSIGAGDGGRFVR